MSASSEPGIVRSHARGNAKFAAGFSRYMESRNLARSTRYQYGRAAGQFVKFIGSQNLITADHRIIRSFLASRRAKGASVGAIHGLRRSLRAFFNFLILAGVLRFSPVEFVAAPKVPRRLPRCLSVQEIEKLLAAAICSRDRAVLELLYASGLRLSELANLRLENVNLSAGTLMVRRGKGDKDRLALFGSKADQSLRDYIGRRTRGPLFLDSHGRALGRAAIAKIVHETASRAGLQGVHTHSLRHSMATHLLNSGADILYVRDLLGHVSVSTTQIYTHTAIADLMSVHSKCHPKGDSHVEE